MNVIVACRRELIKELIDALVELLRKIGLEAAQWLHVLGMQTRHGCHSKVTLTKNTTKNQTYSGPVSGPIMQLVVDPLRAQ